MQTPSLLRRSRILSRPLLAMLILAGTLLTGACTAVAIDHLSDPDGSVEGY